MAQSRESSGLLSLVALRNDAERSQKQAELARAQAEAEQRARLAAERERAREEREREEHERSLHRAAESARRAELTELDHARAVELERAEREARSRRDLELCLGEERLTWRQAEMRLLARIARARSFNLLSAALCLATWLGTVALYFELVRPEAERSGALVLRARADERRARSDAAAAEVRANQREIALGNRVSSLEQALHDERVRSDAPAGGAVEKQVHTGHKQAQVQPITPGRPCKDDGDPLNPCLKR
jgi:hypothetical protein